MPKVVRGKFILEKVLRERINAGRMEAYEKGYQACMFGSDAIATVEPAAFSFTFPADYPANLLYEGPIGFDKHFYPRIGIINGEEAECAQAIDRNPLIKFWVRNLERQPQHAFWLPTSTDKFYPDFVAQLNDGRLLVIEYKGGHLTNEDTKEKELIGKVWAEKSGNLFLMSWKKDKDGRDVYQQINHEIVGR
jgi:type III restriction enzyme